MVGFLHDYDATSRGISERTLRSTNDIEIDAGMQHRKVETLQKSLKTMVSIDTFATLRIPTL